MAIDITLCYWNQLSSALSWWIVRERCPGRPGIFYQLYLVLLRFQWFKSDKTQKHDNLSEGHKDKAWLFSGIYTKERQWSCMILPNDLEIKIQQNRGELEDKVIWNILKHNTGNTIDVVGKIRQHTRSKTGWFLFTHLLKNCLNSQELHCFQMDI